MATFYAFKFREFKHNLFMGKEIYKAIVNLFIFTSKKNLMGWRRRPNNIGYLFISLLLSNYSEA